MHSQQMFTECIAQTAVSGALSTLDNALVWESKV